MKIDKCKDFSSKQNANRSANRISTGHTFKPPVDNEFSTEVLQ